jgi:hypothetical protein
MYSIPKAVVWDIGSLLDAFKNFSGSFLKRSKQLAEQKAKD